MSAMASQITGASIVCSGVDQRKHQSSAPLAFVRGIQRRPVDSLHKGAVTRKIFPFDDVIIYRAHNFVCFVSLEISDDNKHLNALIESPNFISFENFCKSHFSCVGILATNLYTGIGKMPKIVLIQLMLNSLMMRILVTISILVQIKCDNSRRSQHFIHTVINSFLLMLTSLIKMIFLIIFILVQSNMTISEK